MKNFKNGISKLFLVSLIVFGVSTHLYANVINISGIHYMNFNNALADLIGGTTYVEMKKNANNTEELIIQNNKSYPIAIRFFDQEANLFREFIAIPNTNTYMTEALKPFDSPLLVDGKYIDSILDGNLMSSITNTGITSSNLPQAGSINMVFGSTKAQVATIFTIIVGGLDTAAAVANISATNKALPSNLKDILKYMLLDDAIKNPELINSCVTILANSKNYSDDKYENYKLAFMEIKNVYMKYLEQEIKIITYKYLVQGLGIITVQNVNPIFTEIFQILHGIEAFEKLGKNILVPASSLLASYQSEEKLIGVQFYTNKLGSYPFYVKDIPLSSNLYKKLMWLYANGIDKVSNLIDAQSSESLLNPSTPIKTKDFIQILNQISFRINKKTIDYFSNDDYIKKTNTSEYNDYIFKKDAIVVLYEYFKVTYDNIFKVYPLGNKSTLRTIKAIKYMKEYSADIHSLYSDAYSIRISIMYRIIFQNLFNSTSELENRLTKGQAISWIYDYAKYHHIRKNIVLGGK